jgi:adhesin transport system membrane fusion protein
MRNPSPIYVIICLLVGFFIWAALFYIDEAVRAEGILAPRGSVQVVQVADGGVLQELLVNEGDSVSKGQIIAKLEDTRAAARRDELDARTAALQVRRVRAEAEVNGIEPIFNSLPASWYKLVNAQRNLFAERHLLHQQTLQSLSASRELASQEFEMIDRMSREGDTANIRLIQAERDLIDRRQAYENAKRTFRSDALKEISDIDGELFALQFSSEELRNVVEKTVIQAPKSGVVTNIKYETIGAFVSPGEEFLSIAPIDETLEVEIKISPTDVGSLRVGMPIRVSLSAFDPSIYGTLTGNLRLISADAIAPETGASTGSHFKGIANIDWKNNTRITPDLLRPGMVATIDIKTGSRSVLRFLLKPLLRGSSRVFTER